METGKPQSSSALLYGSVAVPTERKMDARAPLTAVYIQAVPAPPPPQQLFPQAQFPGNPLRAPTALRLAVPPLHTKDALPFLTVHIACGLQPLRQELGLPTAIPLAPLASVAPVARPKSAGKHVCPHCSRDCMKPSVLEKHLRCHTGERPYPCITCRVSFKTQSNLYKHKRTQAHARLSSESEQSASGGSNAGSQESAFGSSLCGSSLDSQVEEESGSLEEEVFPVTKHSCAARLNPATDPERGPAGDRVQEKTDLSSGKQKTETNHVPGVTKEEARGKESETKKCQSVTAARHLPLQRQEATLIFKEWEGPASRGKPQSHESTDSGFSESADNHLDGPPECTGEQAAAEPAAGQNGPDPRDGVWAREQRSLEERISKLISENSVVVNDKQLETMRPRKTMLSKQGSIDLPMPYTYKDSFHFDMRNNLPAIARLHGNRRPVPQGSLQPPGVASAEQAPLTRSSSLPYSVALLAPEQSGRGASHPRDCVTQIRRGSSGPVHPAAFPGKSVDQQVPAHHPLVRQTAVDCNHATDGPFCAHPSAGRPPTHSELSCDGGGGDICGEPSDRKRPRKKSQKFTYNKWYAYKGGTFKKLYGSAKEASSAGEEPSPSRPDRPSAVQSGRSLPGGHGDGARTACAAADGVTAGHPSRLHALPAAVPAVELNPKPRVVHQACSTPQPPSLSHVSLSTLHVTSNKSPENHSSTYIMGRPAERLTGKEKHADSFAQSQRAHIPSDRKKQRTNDISVVNPSRTEADHSTPSEPSSSVTDASPTQNTNVRQARVPSHQRVDQHGGGPPAQCINLLSSIKPSFLPKYQLKLPTATETRSTPSLHALKVSKRTDEHIFSSTTSSDNQRIPSIGDATSSGNECALQRRVLSGYQSTEGRTSTQTVNHRDSLVTGVHPRGAPALAVSQRHCTTITTATATMRSRHTELCSPTRTQASTFSSVMAPLAQCLSRPAPQGRSIMTLSTERRNGQSPFVPSSPAALSSFSPGQNVSRPHPSRAVPSPGEVSRTSPAPAGHTVTDLPFQMLPFEAGQLDPVQKVFHVQTADLQICLQIISDEQLALFEPRMEKQAATSQKPPQTTALNSTAPIDGAKEKMAHQSTFDQRAINNMPPPPSPDPPCTMLNSTGQEDVSQVPVSGNTNVSWSLQPPSHTNSDSNHNTAAADDCYPGCTVPTEALSKAARPDARKTKGECDQSFSTGFAANELGDLTPLVPRELLQEGSHGYQHTPLGQRLITCTTDGVPAELNERACTPAASQVSDQDRPLPQRGLARAQTHAATGHVVHPPGGGDGSSLFPDVDDKLCGASAGVNAGPPAGGGGDGGNEGGDRADPGPGHSDTRLQTLRRIDLASGLGGPLIQSSSSRRTAVRDSGDAPAGLARPQASGPPRGGSMRGGGPASLKAPGSHGCWSSPGQTSSAGRGPAPSSPDPWEKDQQRVEEAAESTRVGACSAADLPALPPFHTEHGAASSLAATPADGLPVSPLTPADGDDVILPQTATEAGGDRHGRGQTLDRSPGSSRVARSGPPVGLRDAGRGEADPPRADAGRPARHPPETPGGTSRPAAPWDPPASTWEAMSAVIRTALTPSSETLLEPSPLPVPDAPPRSGRHAHSAATGTAPGEGGVAATARGHAAYCGDPLGGGAGGGFPSGLYQHQHHHHHLHHHHLHHHHLHHRQGEEVEEEEEGGLAVFSDAQLGGHQFVEGPAAANPWPLLPNCQGNQEESSSDDDDEGKLIIEL